MTSDRTSENVAAWDQLYGRSPARVWGDDPIGFLPAWQQRLERLALARRPLLEAGVGEGRNLAFLQTLQAELYACDAAAEALRKIPAPLQSTVALTQCELSETPYAQDFFGLIALFDVFETLPEPQAVLQELHRITMPGGYLFTNIPDDSDGVAGIEMSPLPQGGFLFKNRFFYRFYQAEEAIALAEEAGWRLQESELCTWREDPHPHFRSEAHEHTSRVFLFQKAPGKNGRTAR